MKTVGIKMNSKSYCFYLYLHVVITTLITHNNTLITLLYETNATHFIDVFIKEVRNRTQNKPWRRPIELNTWWRNRSSWNTWYGIWCYATWSTCLNLEIRWKWPTAMFVYSCNSYDVISIRFQSLNSGVCSISWNIQGL